MFIYIIKWDPGIPLGYIRSYIIKYYILMIINIWFDVLLLTTTLIIIYLYELVINNKNKKKLLC